METINMSYWRSLQVQVFDPAAFIQGVHDKYVNTNGGATMDALQQQWDATLAMSVSGDASVCPYHPGVPRFALMEVWHKAGDFWRAGYRPGDQLLCDQYGHALHPWMLELIGKPLPQQPLPQFLSEKGGEPVQLELF